ncbi:MAG: hypothetical protein MJ065_05220 [Oscillospiraceae bacterium]|nr:hypothetical protein [Oscillospiraceae bacterium]
MNRKPRRTRVSEYTLDFDKQMLRLLTEETEQAIRGTEPDQHQILLRAFRMAWEHELTPIQRKYLRCCYQDGMRLREIAARYGVAISTVHRSMTGAKKKLRHILLYFLT